MPPIDSYKCTKCDFRMPSGWGTYLYALDSDNNRIRCPHPGEHAAVKRITGLPLDEAKERNLVGRVSYCVCKDCSELHELDLKKDPIRCTKCNSLDIVSQTKLIGDMCPKCKKGIFTRFPSEIMC